MSYDNVARGGEGMGIGDQYPVVSYGVPFDGVCQTRSLDSKEMTESGFPRSEILIAGEEMHYLCLVVDDAVVATWDEGRWWTPSESEAFVTVLSSPLMKQMAEATAMNREQRRRRKRG
jgi:hypothetical protein